MKNMSTKQEEQFTMIPHSLMSNKLLTDQDKLTLGVILSFIKNGKECYIGNDTLGEMLGITKNAASSRVLRLQKIGCISLRYTYREGTKEVDKRFITLLSLTPQVSSDTQEVSSTKRKVSSDRQMGIVHETKGYRPTDDEVSSKLGGIIQPDNTSVLDNLKNKVLNTLPHKELNNEISVEEQYEYECEPELMFNEIEEQLELEQLQLELMLNEISLEEQLEQILQIIKEDKFKTPDERGMAFMKKEKLEKQLIIK